MIKKITVCFLVMVILVGCAQAPVEADKPEEPPVVEQPQNPEEETKQVKKIDESKDWVYLSERRAFPNLEIDANIEAYIEQLSLDEWIIDYSKSHPIDTVQLNINSEDASRINKELVNLANSKYNSGAIGIQPSLRMRYWITDEILVLFMKNMVIGPGVTIQHYNLYSIDLTSGKQLNSDYLLKYYGIDDIQQVINNTLANEEREICNDLINSYTEGCYFEEKIPGVNLLSKYSDESILFIDNEGNLCIVIDCVKMIDKEAGYTSINGEILKINK